MDNPASLLGNFKPEDYILCHVVQALQTKDVSLG